MTASTLMDRNAHGGTMADMPPKKKKTDAKKPVAPNRAGVSFTLWIPEAVNQKIDSYLESLVPAPTKKALFIAAMNEFIDRRLGK